MDKTFKSLLLASTFLTLVACGGNDTGTNGESSVSESSQMESEVSSIVESESGSESSEMASSSQPVGAGEFGPLLTQFSESIRGDKYFIAYDVHVEDSVEPDPSDYQTKVAVDNDKAAFITVTDNVTSHTIMKDGNLYMIDEVAKQIMVSKLGIVVEEEENWNPIDLEDTEFLESGREGNLDFETYRRDDQLFTYYFSGSELKKMVFDDGISVTTMEVTEISNNPPAEMFELPEGYKEIGMEDFGSESEE
ncbi:hypothetical protein [Jeotgalibaca sp. A122]|uniref:hypothetical protein n=1 Tax=Jeotgalibaca sp. A122 TaxID=3457322 RepID=UPI003FCFE143